MIDDVATATAAALINDDDAMNNKSSTNSLSNSSLVSTGESESSASVEVDGGCGGDGSRTVAEPIITTSDWLVNNYPHSNRYFNVSEYFLNNSELIKT